MKIIINENNLRKNEIKEYNLKAKAILINEKEEILIANYSGVYLLPGSKVNYNENIETSLLRELKEETGINYNSKDLKYLCHIDHFKKNYPKTNGKIQNRLISTHYYIGKYKKILPGRIKLTENEQKGNFKLELIPLNKLKNIIITNKNNNPRNIYFQKELLKIIDFYQNLRKTTNQI